MDKLSSRETKPISAQPLYLECFWVAEKSPYGGVNEKLWWYFGIGVVCFKVCIVCALFVEKKA